MIKRVESKIEEYVASLDDNTIWLYKKLPNGKRLRAKLILKIAQTDAKAVELAAIVELIHVASLLHDDVIDDAMQRRGVDSINAIYGNKSAIMLGDILYSKGYLELATFDKEISQTIANAVTYLSMGELMDVKLADEFNVDRELYFDMIYKKTAVLIEASAKSAAILEGKDSKAYALYGKNLGLAFQIVDDLLDITQDSKILGKPAMSDFREGKVTLPYIYLYQELDQEGKDKLKSFYKKELSSSQIGWILKEMDRYGVIDRSIKEAKELGSEALEAIRGDKNRDLELVITNMIERSF